MYVYLGFFIQMYEDSHVLVFLNTYTYEYRYLFVCALT